MSKVKVVTHVFPESFSEFILYELDPRYSRDTVQIAANSGDLPLGMILTKNADKTFAPLKTTDSVLGDAHAVLLQAVPNATEAQPALVLRGYSIVNGSKLPLHESVTDRAAALESLRERGFVVKEVPSDATA